jgi:CRP-like cAMP-binding protein
MGVAGAGGGMNDRADGGDPNVAGTLTLVEKTAFMKSVELLASIPTEALAQLAARTEELQLDAGEVLFREGDPNRGSFLVIEGTIELRRQGTLLRRVSPRMVFGEPFLEEETHQVTAVAVEPSHLLNLQSQDVLDGVMEYPEFGVAIVRTLALRSYRLNERVLELEQHIERLEQRQREAGPATEARRAPEPHDRPPRRR